MKMPATLTMFGIIALLGGSVGYFALPYGISASIKSFMNLAENGTLFSLYMDTRNGRAPPYYLFAIKNPEAVLNGGRATFELKGPYMFASSLERENIQFSAEGQKVSFDTRQSFTLDESHSADFDEQMWLVNPVMLATAQMTKTRLIDRVPFGRYAEPIVLGGLGAALDSFNEQPIVQTTPRKMLLGRRVKLLDMLSSIGVGQFSSFRHSFFGLVPEARIESMEMWTGVGETRHRFADVARYKGQNRMSVWRDNRCNTIRGTNGELHKPYPKRGKALRIFAGKLCRSIDLDPTGDELVKTGYGAMALEYELSKRSYQGARTNPANECYCSNTRTYDCQYDGLLELAPCYNDAPLYLAQANFKDVDPRISDLVDWRSAIHFNDTSQVAGGELKQLPAKQLFRVDPITGLVLEFELSLMVLIKMVRNPKLRQMSKIQPIAYMPLFATSESFKSPKEMVWPLIALQKINDYQDVAMMGAALVGVGSLLASSLLL